jgi:hypothetical protein
MEFTLMAGLFLLQAAGVIYLSYKPKEEEPNLFLKLIGYSVLGTFSFGINSIKLPLGFAVFLLFFRPAINSKRKKQAAFLGLAVFLLSILIPFLQKEVYEWPRTVQLENKNFYKINMQEEWKKIREELHAPSESFTVVNDFEAVIDRDGDLADIRMSLTEQQDAEVVHYRVELSSDRDWLISRMKYSDWMMSPDSEEAGHFLRHIDYFTPGVLNDDSTNYYSIQSSFPQRMGYAVREQKKYILSEDGRTEILNNQLPVEGVMLDVCGTSGEIDEHGNIFDCSLNEHYLYDVSFPELEVREGNIIELAMKNPEVDRWFMEHTGEAIGSEKDGTYILKQDGKETEVSEQEYIRALKETPYISVEQHDGYWSAEVENPYGDEPHVLEVKVDGDTGDVIEHVFR